MENLDNVLVEYFPGRTIEIQGNRQEIQKYLDDGYYIKEDRNGYWVLVKTAKVQAILTNSYGTKIFNVKDKMLSYYRRERITEKLVNQFQNDIYSGKIILKMNRDLSDLDIYEP